MKIMIVEDEQNIREELKQLLENSLYQVIMIEEFQDVTGQIEQAAPDLVLLDIKLPNKDGHEICRQLREKSQIPIIFITSDENVMTEINSILLGGDDYITKPYHPSVLLARISAVLKRTRKQEGKEEQLLIHNGLTMDLHSYKIRYGGNEEDLSKNEFKLLHYLFQRKGEVVPRLDIIEYLWDNDVFIDDNALSVNVTRLRSKLERLGIPDYIKTKRGVGYLI